MHSNYGPDGNSKFCFPESPDGLRHPWISKNSVKESFVMLQKPFFRLWGRGFDNEIIPVNPFSAYGLPFRK